MMRLGKRNISREVIERESHYLWGRRHLLTVIERDTKPFVTVDHKRITLSVRPGSDHAKPDFTNSRRATLSALAAPGIKPGISPTGYSVADYLYPVLYPVLYLDVDGLDWTKIDRKT